jgi:PAS domain S-box-containing protein
MCKFRRSDDALRYAAEEWRSTFDSITDPISIHDTDYRITRLNKAFAAAYAGGDIAACLGRRCYEVIHGTAAPPEDCPHRKVMEERQPVNTEHYDVAGDRFLDVSVSPVIGEDDRVSGVVHIIRDITERKRMEENLIVTDRMVSLGEMASGLAHEVNNPLTGVIGFAQLVLSDPRLPAGLKSDLEMVSSEARRAAEVVQKMLNFARGGSASVGSVDVNQTLLNVVRLREYELRANNITVDKRLTLSLPQVNADAMELQQVLVNLIINAEYFMDKYHRGGQLELTTEEGEGVVRIIIADDGPGIAPDKLAQIFSPFFTTKDFGQGTGLGLSICRGIVTRHGGTIRAESETGSGARFIIEFPVAEVTEA